jgi:hypothetical protein
VREWYEACTLQTAPEFASKHSAAINGQPSLVWEETEMASHSSSRISQRPLVTALFKDRDHAERAYQSLIDLGYSRDDINVVMSDETRSRHFPADRAPETELGHKTLEGAGVGGAIGTTVGALLGALAAIGTSIVVPGLGLVIAGPIAAALAGAGAGAMTGGLIGALIGSGIPEERAKVYEQGIREGGILLTAEPRTDADAERIEREWKGYGGDLVHR